MNIDVQQAGVFQGAIELQRFLEHFDGLGRVRALRDLPGLEIPQSPGRTIHDGFAEQSRNLEVVTEFGVYLAHRIGEIVIPRGSCPSAGTRAG